MNDQELLRAWMDSEGLAGRVAAEHYLTCGVCDVDDSNAFAMGDEQEHDDNVRLEAKRQELMKAARAKEVAELEPYKELLP